MKGYLKRIADIVLERKLASKGAVLIEGAKWCGKTTTASMQSNSTLYMHEPDKKTQNIELSEVMPSKLLEGNTPRLIDEWQIAPNLWDAIRFEVDKRNQFGQFILTGSSVPVDTTKIFHSGVGRISRMLMRPMSLYESLDSNGQVSLSDIFDNKNIEGENEINLDRLAFLICRGGWPKAINVTDSIALLQSIDYYEAIIN
ncbi:MAG: AAA family ATPase, partial [Methanobacteriaceae archaeon]|nr:AAA family ATPase [Methanobacteriaceae archaeon]